MVEANTALESIACGVNSYLEEKRLYFPRFFFLSNDEMMEILSETRDPLRTQPHLHKLFQGIHALTFNEQSDILSMISNETEEIPFLQQISTAKANGCVEKWLLLVEDAMVASVQNENANSFFDYEATPQISWLKKWPQMSVLCLSQIYWASDVESYLQSKSLNGLIHLQETIQDQIIEALGVVRSRHISNLLRITIRSLIVFNVHAKDVVAELIKNNIISINDFQWLAQLRYYWIDGEAHVKMIHSTIRYANEYLGNSDRLVCVILFHLT